MNPFEQCCYWLVQFSCQNIPRVLLFPIVCLVLSASLSFFLHFALQCLTWLPSFSSYFLFVSSIVSRKYLIPLQLLLLSFFLFFFLSSFFFRISGFLFYRHIVKMGVFFREQNYNILPSNCRRTRRRRRKQTVENKKSMHVQTSILYIYLFSFVLIRSSTMKNMNNMKTIWTRSLIL